MNCGCQYDTFWSKKELFDQNHMLLLFHQLLVFFGEKMSFLHLCETFQLLKLFIVSANDSVDDCERVHIISLFGICSYHPSLGLDPVQVLM